MPVPTNIYEEILVILRKRFGKSLTLEQLTNIIIPTENIFDEREAQSKILDALILLNREGYIVLNPENDESSIPTKNCKN